MRHTIHNEKKINFNNIHLFKWGELYYIEMENELVIDAIRKLNINQEKSLAQIKKDFEEILKKDKFLNHIEPELQGSYYSQFFEIEERTIKELQQQQRYSIVLATYSFFEGRLKSICKLIEDTFDFKIKLDDLKNDEYLTKYWNYLKKVYEIETQSIEPFFTPVKQQKIIRNIIAHQEGIIHKQQIDKITLVKGLTIREFGDIRQIEIGKNEFVTYLLDNMESFFKKLLITIDKKYSEKA